MNQRSREDRNRDEAGTRRGRLEHNQNQLAAAAGMSARQWRRLIQSSKDVKGEYVGYQFSAKLIGALGHPELLTPQALEFFHEFVSEFIEKLAAHIAAEGPGMDPRWAKAQARKTIEAFQIAVERRRQLMDLQDTEVLRGFGNALSAEIASQRSANAGK
jgi:hypothetical protein